MKALFFLVKLFADKNQGFIGVTKLNHCSQFLLGITVAPREIEDSGYAFFFCMGGGGGGVDKVHYGLCENGEFPKQSHSAIRHNTQPRVQGYSFLPFFLRKKTLETSLKHSLNMAYI